MKERFRENCDEQRVQSRETKCTLVCEPMIQLDAEESLGWNFRVQRHSYVNND